MCTCHVFFKGAVSYHYHLYATIYTRQIFCSSIYSDGNECIGIDIYVICRSKISVFYLGQFFTIQHILFLTCQPNHSTVFV